MRKLNEVLVKSGLETYREIISVVLYSLVGSAVLIPMILLVPVPLVPVLLPLFYMPLLYGALYAYHQRAEGRRSGLRALFAGARKGFGPSVVFGYLCVLLLLILWSTWWYYGGKNNVLSLSVSVFQTYFVLMAFASQFYTLQLVLQKDMGIFQAMGESVKLFFRKPGYTLGACFQALCIAVPLLLTVVGFLALYNGFLAIFQHKAAINAFDSEDAADGSAADVAGGGYR